MHELYNIFSKSTNGEVKFSKKEKIRQGIKLMITTNSGSCDEYWEVAPQE